MKKVYFGPCVRSFKKFPKYHPLAEKARKLWIKLEPEVWRKKKSK